MTTSLLTALLLLSGPADLPTRTPAVADAPAAAPTGAPAQPPAASPAPSLTAAPDLRLPRGGFEPGAFAAPALLLAGLGVAALLLRRRRRPGVRRIEVLESTSVGPKRTLVLARFGDELLLLGSSEAGIQLLHHRPGHADEATAAPEDDALPAPAPAPTLRPARREPPGALSGLVTKLRRARPETSGPSQFDALLAESAEDQELRRKLARGQAGSVR